MPVVGIDELTENEKIKVEGVINELIDVFDNFLDTFALLYAKHPHLIEMKKLVRSSTYFYGTMFSDMLHTETGVNTYTLAFTSVPKMSRFLALLFEGKDAPSFHNYDMCMNVSSNYELKLDIAMTPQMYIDRTDFSFDTHFFYPFEGAYSIDYSDFRKEISMTPRGYTPDHFIYTKMQQRNPEKLLRLCELSVRYNVHRQTKTLSLVSQAMGNNTSDMGRAFTSISRSFRHGSKSMITNDTSYFSSERRTTPQVRSSAFTDGRAFESMYQIDPAVQERARNIIDVTYTGDDFMAVDMETSPRIPTPVTSRQTAGTSSVQPASPNRYPGEWLDALTSR